MLAAILTSACTTKKAAVKALGTMGPMQGKDRSALLAHILQNTAYYDTFSGKAKAHVSVNKEEYDATLSIRIIRGKAIWISVTALLGIEAARLLITPDSILLINRLQKVFVRQPYPYLRQYTGEDVPYPVLEELLTGQAIARVLNPQATLSRDTSGYRIKGDLDAWGCTMQANGQYHIQNTAIYTSDSTRGLWATYSNYGSYSGQYLPKLLTLQISTDPLNLKSSLEYSRIVCGEEVAMPFTIPAKYEEME